MSDERRVTIGSGNVYADLEFDDPDLELAKAELARQIVGIITSRRLTQVQAAGLLGIDQPKVSALVNGRLGIFSTERLMRFLTRLDLDVDIVVAPKGAERAAARIAVHSDLGGTVAGSSAARREDGATVSER